MYFYFSNDSLIKPCPLAAIFKNCYCLVYIFNLTNIDTLYKLEEMIK